MAPDAASLVRGFSLTYEAWQSVRAVISPLSIAALMLGIALPCLPARLSCPVWLKRAALLLLLIVCYAHLLATGYAPLLYAQF